MPLRIFVRVVGFTDVERHALNTVFRLSEERDTRYSLWADDAPEAAKLALVDGQSNDAQDWLESIPAHHKGELIWVGPVAPAHAAFVFARPLHWPDVVLAMDQLFAPPTTLDFDLDIGGDPAQANQKHALVLDADRDARLYFRAKLGSVGIFLVDEALAGAQALGMLRTQPYDVAIIDLGLPDPNTDVWQLLREVMAIKPPVPLVLISCLKPSMWVRIKAWFAGVHGVLSKPPHPGKLQKLLRKL